MKNIPLNAQLFSPPPLIAQFEQGDYNAYGQLYSGYVSISFLRVGFDTKITEATSIKVNDIEYVGLETPSFSWTEQINNNNDWINIPIFKNDNYNIKVIIRGSEYRDSLLVTKIETEIASTKTLRKKNSTSVLRGSVINSLEDENDEVNAPSIAAVNEKLKNLSTQATEGDKVGSIKLFGGSVAPEGWLLCDGSAVNRITYKDLFSVIGTTYGEGDGSTTFNIPDIKGKTVVGLDNSDTDFESLGKVGGSKYTERHTHTSTLITRANGNANANTWGEVQRANNNVGNRENKTDSFSSNGYFGTGNSGNLQPYIILNYIIKATAVTPMTGQVIDNLDGDSTTDAPSIHIIKEKIRNIIESGDGYIKYSDGTMICYGEYTGTSELFDYFGWCIRTAENINITFKKEFLSAPMVTITPRYNSYIFSIAINQISATGFKFTGLKPSGARSSTYINMNYMAIGKWK